MWLLLGGTDARANPELFVDLRYEVDPALAGCPNQAQFQAIVARQLGYDPHRAGSTFGVAVRAWQAGRKIEGTIDWSGIAAERVGGQRFVSRNRDCDEMMATMGFAMAVQIQVMTRAEPVASTTPKSADAAQATPPQTPSAADRDREKAADRDREKAADRDREKAADRDREKAPAASAPRSSPWSVMAGLGGAVGLGLGPSPIAQGRLFASVQFGRAALEVAAEASLPSTTRQDYGGGFQHDLVLGTLAACGQQGSIFLCGLAKMGRIQVTGVGVDRPASHDGFVALLGLRLGYSLALSDRVAILGRFDALVPATSWTVDLNHVAVWTMPRIGAAAGIDVAARFR